MKQLTGVINSYPQTRTLVGATLDIGDATKLKVVSREGAPGFDRLLSELTCDVFELPVLSLAIAREVGIPIRAIPAFLTRRFVHSKLYFNRAVVPGPEKLAGHRIGVLHHGWTDGAWARGLLSRDFGVDPGEVTWVTAAKERIAHSLVPHNVELAEGAALGELLQDGEIAALVRHSEDFQGNADIVPVYGDLRAEEAKWWASTSVFPVLHTIVVKEAALRAHPELAKTLLEVIDAQQNETLSRLAGGGTPRDEAESEIVAQLSIVGTDAFRNGVEPNRPAIEMLLDFAHQQRVISSVPSIEELFVG